MPKISDEQFSAVKEEILKQAMYIIVEEGLDQLTMRKLAVRMDMTATNLYHYYNNKERIYLELDRKGYSKLFDMFSEAVKSQKDKLDKIKALIQAYVKFGLENSYQYNMMFNKFRSPKAKDEKSARKQTREAKVKSIFSLTDPKRTKNALVIFRNAVADYISSNPNLQGKDAELITIYVWAEFHGLISLFSSGILDEFGMDPMETINE
jgi:AcrR family transcriptional regulator